MDEKKSRQYAMRSLLAMCFMTFSCAGLTWSTFSLYSNSVVREWGISGTQFMVSMTILVVVNAMCSIFLYGWLHAKLGTRRFLLIGGILMAVSQLVYALSNSLAMLYLAALIMGFGIVPLTGNTNMIVTNGWFGKRAGTYLGISNTVGSITGIVASYVYGALMGTAGWRTLLFITFGVDVAALILIQVFYKGEPEQVGVSGLYQDDGAQTGGSGQAETGVGLAGMLKSPRFYLLSLAYLLVGIGGYGAMGNLTLMMADFGFEAQAGTVVAAALLGSAATMVIGGTICDKLGSKWFITIAMVLVCGAMLLLRIDNVPFAVVIAAAILLGVGYNTTQFPPGITVKEVFGTRELNKKLGIVNGCCLIGLGFGPTIMEAVTEAVGGYSRSLMIFIAGTVLAIVLMLISCSKTVKQ